MRVTRYEEFALKDVFVPGVRARSLSEGLTDHRSVTGKCSVTSRFEDRDPGLRAGLSHRSRFEGHQTLPRDAVCHAL